MAHWADVGWVMRCRYSSSMRTVLLLPLVLSLACSSSQRPYPAGTVSHVVVCYLKKPGDAEGRRKLIEASKEFREIPGVLSVEVGRVLPSTRPIVVNDYDVALVITYEDVEAMNAYVTHPIHERAVKEVLQPLTAKVVVYDFVNE
jgi:heme-degrading monooxygenase HmoA